MEREIVALSVYKRTLACGNNIPCSTAQMPDGSNFGDHPFSGVTLLCAAPLLIEICCPYRPLIFCVPKKNQIFFSRRPNAKLDREVHK